MLAVVTACAAVAGCVPKTDVSMAANVQQQYSHVWVTVAEVWFNTDDTATAADSSWSKFLLDKPITVDLASLTNGTLRKIANNVKLPTGTYKQIRLLPLDGSTALTSAADDEGADYNCQANFIDSSGKSRKLPLELLNPAEGIAVRTSFKLKSDNTAGSGTPDDTSLVFALDGMHDLVQFNYGSKIGVLLNPHATAYDVSEAGTIRGMIDLANIGTSINSSGQVNVAVTAESVSSDGTRHTAVKTVPVAADGSFVLYPLATDSTTSGSYDLVIHGPSIATVIIKSVPVSVGDPSATTAASVGTVPVRAATSFTMNLKDEEQEFPPGALISFYQTLPDPGELPYLIDVVPLDPFSRTLFADQALSQETIDVGTYAASGITLTTATPVQGAGVYILSAQAALFTDGVLTKTVAPSSSGTGTVLATIATPRPVSGSDASSLSLRVAALIPGKYDQGELIVSHDGGIIQTLTLDSALTASGGDTLTLDNLPAGDDADFYYLSVRAWNSDDPEGTLQRQLVITPLDLRAGEISSVFSLIVD